MAEKQTAVDLKIEVKQVKHTFTPEERDGIGGELARAIAGLRGIEAEFDQVKASYKAKTTEAEAKIDNLSTSRMNGFEMRNERCVVLFRPKDRQKDFFVESAFLLSDFATKADAKGLPPVALTEDMSREDFQQELIQAEAKFDKREEIALFQPTETDRGILVVGRLAGKWFTALRIQIGKLRLEERLDSEQKASKQRADAIRVAVSRVKEWAKDNLKDLAKGFEPGFAAVMEAHRERAE